MVIISHNYARFLADAIESVLRQTVRPHEVLVVDDASLDETSAVAEKFADRGVAYLRIDVRNVHLARKAGFEATISPVLCCLDADDVLHPSYLEGGLPSFSDPRVAIVYSDMEYFGAETGTRRVPRPESVNLAHQNKCHAGSLVRRAALELNGAFDEGVVVTRRSQDDWFLWRKTLAAGWTVAKNPSIYRYRRHDASHMSELVTRQASYFDLAALDLETITLFIPLSGRAWAWPTMREFLEQQQWPHSQVRLVLCDTSGDAGFSTLFGECAAPTGTGRRQQTVLCSQESAATPMCALRTSQPGNSPRSPLPPRDRTDDAIRLGT